MSSPGLVVMDRVRVVNPSYMSRVYRVREGEIGVVVSTRVGYFMWCEVLFDNGVVVSMDPSELERCHD